MKARARGRRGEASGGGKRATKAGKEGGAEAAVMREEEGRFYRLCVSCGFTDDKPETPTTPSAVLKGRLEKPLLNKTQAKKLNIIDLNKSS